MEIRLSSLTSLLLCLCLLLNVCGCLGEVTQESQISKATRTIMLYDCGADLEGRYALATWNLYQILESEIGYTFYGLTIANPSGNRIPSRSALLKALRIPIQISMAKPTSSK